MFEELKENGFTKLPCRLSFDDVHKLNNIFLRYHPKNESGFYTSFELESLENKIAIDSEIKRILHPLVTHYFPDFTPLISNFVVKNPGKDSFLPLHRDWSVVDEEKFKSLSIWIPLININDLNGKIGFVKGSHLTASPYRGPSKKDSLYVDNLNEDVTYLPLDKGEILVFYPSTLHLSQPNLQNELRIALTLVLVPKNCKKLHFYFSNENQEKMFAIEVEKEFFFNYRLNQKPKGKVDFVLKNGKKIKFPFSLFFKIR